MSAIMNFSQKLRRYLAIERPWFPLAIKTIWISVPLFFVCLATYIYLVEKNPLNLFGGMPALTAIENPENDLSSEVISADGVSLGRYFYENRSQLTYDQLPPILVKTLISSEDHRFFKHSGMDLWSYVRVGLGLATLNPRGGGSTLTQQTAKNLFSTREEELEGKLGGIIEPIDLLISKTKEWIIAAKLERNFTKEEIIALYLNTVSFGQTTFGIKIAAETYFRKRVRDLNTQECAMLVGMLQNPEVFNPIRHPDLALNKRNDVLQKLVRDRHISESQYDSLASLPVKTQFSIQNQNKGLATYFRTVLKADLMKWCREHGYSLYESGLRIHVTIDSRMQQFAEEAMVKHMKKLQREFDQALGGRDPWVDTKGNVLADFLPRKIRQGDQYAWLAKKYGEDDPRIETELKRKKRMRVFHWEGDRDTLFSAYDSLRYYNRFLNTGLMSMDPSSGAVKAWVGGINHRHFKFDHVYQAKRQPGSTFKPFVYGKAMEVGFSPCMTLEDIAPYININGKIYHPANSNGSYGDGTTYTLRRALAKSLNSITMQLMDKLKPQNVAEFATRMGITSELNPVYSLGLGTSDVSIFELVGAYSSFVNLGIHTDPFYITRIEDKYGNILESFVPKRNQVLDAESAYKIIYLLRGGVEEIGGTSGVLSPAVTENNEVGGKTGTTDNASDGWYVGITSNLVTGVWVGGDERSIHFPSWAMGSGGRSALPMWDLYMQRVYSYREIGYPKGSFQKPTKDLDPKDFNCNSEEEDILP
jgi:penicillin-binding protein 1A